MEYKAQVLSADKYKSRNYVSPRRWSSYAIQVREAMLAKPDKILEIGPGNGIVTHILKDMDYCIDTLDIDERVRADYTGSITDENIIKKLSGQFDLVIACEIFEHVRYEDFLKTLKLLKTVAQKALISLPHTELNSRFFYFALKMPIVKSCVFARKLIYKSFEYEFNGEHYWEMGTKGYSTKKLVKDIEDAGWIIEKGFFNPDNPYHYFFVLKNEGQH